MKYIYTGASIIAILAMTGAEALSGFLFSQWFAGPDPLTRYAWTAATLGSSIGLAFTPVWFFRATDPVARGASALLFLLCLGFGAWTCYGFAARTSATHEAALINHARAMAPVAAAKTLLETTKPVAKKRSALRDRLNQMEQSRRWKSTAACTDATATASIAFCLDHKQVRTNLSTAVARADAMTTINNAPSAVVTDKRNSSGVAIAFAVFLQFGAALSTLAAFGAPGYAEPKEETAPQTRTADVIPVRNNTVTRKRVAQSRATRGKQTGADRLLTLVTSSVADPAHDLDGIERHPQGVTAGLRSFGRHIGIKSPSGVSKAIDTLVAQGVVSSEVCDQGTRLSLKSA